MAEIKSTLDLIMEKTRNLLPSEEEKKALLEKEWAGKIRGLVLRVLDGVMTPKALRSEIASSPAPAGINTGDLLKGELIGKIDPDKDNERIFHLLETLCHEDTAGLKSLIGAYREQVGEKKASLATLALAGLASRGITGDAVLPNVEADEAFRSFLEGERDSFHRKIEAYRR